MATPRSIPYPPGRLKVWLLAIRLPTLAAAVAPVAVGTAVAVGDGVFDALPALAALIGALAIQIGTNLANDVSDFRRGADTHRRVGPPRVTQAGLLSQRQVLTGMSLAFGVGVLAGLYLTAVAGWPVIAIGIASIIAGVAYTAGPWPFGYHGLGEVFTFVFFGVIAVVGTYFVQAETVTWVAVLASVPVGLTVTAILVVNNIRDVDTDREAGKRTLAVRIGRGHTRQLFLAMVIGAYLWTAALSMGTAFSSWVLLSWLSSPLAAAPLRVVLTRVDGPGLNRALRATARLHLAFGLLLAIGLAV